MPDLGDRDTAVTWPVACPTHGLSIDELCIAYCGASPLSRRGMVGGEIPSQAPLGVLHETPRRDENGRNGARR